jgi:6-phosphofructokinase 1
MKRSYRGTVAILTGGGDTCALNRSIETIKNVAYLLDYRVLGIYAGWKGLLGEGFVVDISEQSINGHIGGSILGSSRTNPYKEGQNRVDEVLSNIKRYGIDIIISIGGDDTNGVAQRLYKEHGIPVIGFPKTIDNDIKTQTMHYLKNGQSVEAALCPGFPTAAGNIVQLTASLRTTAMTHNRIFVLEIMGRDAGWLPASSALGGADFILVPEIPMTEERIRRFYDLVRHMHDHEHNDIIIGVSEGVRWWNEKSGTCDVVMESRELDAFGHPRLGGVGAMIANRLREEGINQPRTQVAGYIPRAGRISEYDHQVASALGQMVLKMILHEQFGYMPVLDHMAPFREVEAYNTKAIPLASLGNKGFPAEVYYDENSFNVTSHYRDYLSMMIPEAPRLPQKIEYSKFLPG